MKIKNPFSKQQSSKLSLSKIIIPSEMLSHPPRADNLASKYTYYIRTGNFLSPITIDKKNILIDGYITYLIAKMMGYKTVEVKFI
jgi:hypothetical protein